MKKMYGIIVLLACLTIISPSLGEEKDTLSISQWKNGTSLNVNKPFFHDRKDINNNEYSTEKLLEQAGVEITDLNSSFKWKDVSEKHGFLYMTTGSGDYTIQYLRTNFYANAFFQGNLNLMMNEMAEIYLDGKLLKSKKSHEEDSLTGNVNVDLALTTGNHEIILKVLSEKSKNSSGIYKAFIVYDKEKYRDVELKFNESNKRIMNLADVLNTSKVTGVSISSDGKYAAVYITRSVSPAKDYESWVDVYNLKTNKKIHSFRKSLKLSDIAWVPGTHCLSYKEKNDKKTEIWKINVETSGVEKIMEGVTDFGSYYWSPTGDYFVYDLSIKPKDEKKDLKRLDGPMDHLPWWKNRNQLHVYYPKDKKRQPLTAGLHSMSVQRVSKDGKKILVSKNVPDYSQRPYSVTTYYVINPYENEMDSLFQIAGGAGACFSPDGDKLLVTGSATLFDNLGNILPDEVIPNNYDTQAYIYDLETKKVVPISKDFNPNITAPYWVDKEVVYFLAEDETRKRLFKYDIKDQGYKKLDLSLEVISGVDFSEDGKIAVYCGCSAQFPHSAYQLDLKKTKSKLLSSPEKKRFENVMLGELKDWDFESDEGKTIKGRFYLPPHFDENEKYPLLVYYYGGTSPVERSFGGRYPMNYYAANGYVVYVLQPSGATGFGQEFSAAHVNDWGKTTTKEIIKGVGEFVKEHSFVDEKRIGCMGASYGGFMTMKLMTETDLFAGAISHAGISSISSYWGEGYWGYLYSGTATANSFPWNRKDIYVEQSPLFHADKITTPLLLLHGNQDTNVPRGESRQLYAALKLLGKPVELIEVDGQDHWILDYNKRVKWTETIMAWFDKQLKKDDNWWNYLYPEK